MASIRNRDGVWQARVIRKGHPSVCRSFPAHQEAAQWARSIELDIDRGNYQSRTEAERLTFADIIGRYMEEVAPHLKGWKYDCFRLAALKRHSIAKYSMVSLTPKRLAGYRDERLAKVSAGTVIRELAYISAIINHSRREWGINIQNPVALGRKPPAPKGRDRVLTEPEIATIIQELEPIRRRNIWMKPLVQLALETAMRRGELLALRWENVNFRQQVAFLEDTKNGESRNVPLSKTAIAVLHQIPRSLTGRVIPLTIFAMEAAFKQATKRAYITGVRFHDLRHTAITRMATLLPNLIELSAVSGHKNLSMLKRYYHPDAKVLARKLG